MPDRHPPDKPQGIFRGSLRQAFYGVEYQPGLSDAEYTQKKVQELVRGNSTAVEILSRIERKTGSGADMLALHERRQDVAGVLREHLSGLEERQHTNQELFLNRLSQDLVGPILGGLERIYGGVEAVRNDVVETRVALEKALGEGFADTVHAIDDLRSSVDDMRRDIVAELASIGVELKSMHATMRSPQETRAKEHIRSAVEFMKLRRPDFESAQLELQDSLQSHRNNPVAHYLLALCEVELGNADAARAHFRKGLNMQQVRKTAAQYSRDAARLEIAVGDTRAAEDVLAEGQELDPTNGEILLQLAAVRASNRNQTGAIQAIVQAIALSPAFEKRAMEIPLLDELVLGNIQSIRLQALSSTQVSVRTIQYCFDVSRNGMDEKVYQGALTVIAHRQPKEQLSILARLLPCRIGVGDHAAIVRSMSSEGLFLSDVLFHDLIVNGFAKEVIKWCRRTRDYRYWFGITNGNYSTLNVLMQHFDELTPEEQGLILSRESPKQLHGPSDDYWYRYLRHNRERARSGQGAAMLTIAELANNLRHLFPRLQEECDAIAAAHEEASRFHKATWDKMEALRRDPPGPYNNVSCKHLDIYRGVGVYVGMKIITYVPGVIYKFDVFTLRSKTQLVPQIIHSFTHTAYESLDRLNVTDFFTVSKPSNDTVEIRWPDGITRVAL